MVLYHENGRVVKQHENYLEQAARSRANKFKYQDQIDIAKTKDLKACEENDVTVHIIVESQWYRELYRARPSEFTPEMLNFSRAEESQPIPAKGLDRKTLMKCSSTANDFFTYQPRETKLHVPVYYPRLHIEGLGVYVNQDDDQMAYVREEEIIAYIVPWVKDMEKVVKASNKKPANDLPAIDIPPTLLEKIHLYNVMLQLGISSYFQRPLIDALVLQMYQTPLKQCHLDTLEMTVCRFYSRGVAILDPVINHLIGTYSLRSVTDRRSPVPDNEQEWLLPEIEALEREKEKEKEKENKNEDESEVSHNEPLKRYLPRHPERAWLEYTAANAGRRDYPRDTISVPPKLEVIAHCIRHWSGVRRNGSTVAAHTGFPLNVGRVFKYYRRQARDPIVRTNNATAINVADYSTNRLHKFKYYRENAPGLIASTKPDEEETEE